MQVRKSVGALVVACSAAAHAQDLPLKPLPAPGLPIQPIAEAQATPSSASANPAAPVLPIQPVWTLVAGQPIGRNLQTWAEQAGWTVVWQVRNDWIVPSGLSYTGSFAEAAETVIKTLAENGAVVDFKTYEGNKLFRVWGAGAQQ